MDRMARDLRAYNRLNYNEESSEKSKFVDFLFRNTEIIPPKTDENKAWEALNQKIHNSNKFFIRMKVAAAIAILAVLSVTVYLFNPLSPSQVHVATVNEKKNITFPDGSIGVLNMNSSFTFPKEFGDERNVSFTGEAYFDVKKNKKTFIVNANGVNLRVIGTAFNLISTKSNVRLYVERGVVALENEGKQTLVSAGKHALFNRKNASVEVKTISSTNNIMSWRNGVFTFDRIPLKDVLNKLRTHYDVKFELSNKKLGYCRISGTFNKQKLNEILETIEGTLNVNTFLENNLVIISGQGC